MKHLFSESAVWITESEFVKPNGEKSVASGESQIQVNEYRITNRSWVISDEKRIENNYLITPISESRFQYNSENPDLGIQKGYFDINGNKVFSKFSIESTNLNGYETIIREDNTCFAYGALYNVDELINTWTARMTLKNL